MGNDSLRGKSCPAFPSALLQFPNPQVPWAPSFLQKKLSDLKEESLKVSLKEESQKHVMRIQESLQISLLAALVEREGPPASAKSHSFLTAPGLCQRHHSWRKCTHI